jgi:hypothetical protein
LDSRRASGRLIADWPKTPTGQRDVLALPEASDVELRGDAKYRINPNSKPVDAFLIQGSENRA